MVIAQISNPYADIVIPVGIPIKETKAKYKTHPVTTETKILIVQYDLEFLCLYSSIHFDWFL